MIESSMGYAQLDGGQTFYETAGHGENLILLHAGFVDSCMWDPQWNALRQRYRVTRYDLRGFGKSSVADREMSRREEIYRLLNHLDIHQAHILGCELGGTVALDFALEHPDRVKSLGLISTIPSGFETQNIASEKLLAMKAALERRDLRQASELQLQLWFDGPFRHGVQMTSHVRQAVAMMNQVAVANKTWLTADLNPIDPLTPPAARRLNDLQAPTLIIVGALDDPTVLAAANDMASHLIQAQKRIMPDCGRLPNMEQPEVFTQTVLKFLASI